MSKSTEAGREFVQYALYIGALELLPNGRTLKSGRLSPYFFNSGLFNTGQALSHLGEAYASAIQLADRDDALRPDVIFGPPYKGIPLAVVTACVLSGEAMKYEDVAWAFNRKEAKAHGEGGTIVGADLNRKRVIIVDDVITDGASKREAGENILTSGGEPVACVIAFDRQERGGDPEDSRSAAQVFYDTYGIPVIAAANLDDLIEVLQGGVFLDGSVIPLAKETLPLILAYREQYGQVMA